MNCSSSTIYIVCLPSMHGNFGVETSEMTMRGLKHCRLSTMLTKNTPICGHYCRQVSMRERPVLIGVWNSNVPQTHSSEVFCTAVRSKMENTGKYEITESYNIFLLYLPNIEPLYPLCLPKIRRIFKVLLRWPIRRWDFCIGSTNHG
jgi:hypothetical protein